jgi:hypothetical protein
MHPLIAAKIAVPTPTLNLASARPFTIKITFQLIHDCPITFENTSANLFDGLALREPGLTFTNTRTGQQVPRNHIYICRMGDTGPCLEKDPQCFTTLSPQSPYSIEATLEPIDDLVSEPQFETALSDMSRDPKTHQLTWRHVHGLENGEEYRLGISDDAKVSDWMRGTRQSILSQRWWRWLLGIFNSQPQDTSNAPIKFLVIETAQFDVIRTPKDGGWDWPPSKGSNFRFSEAL